MRLEGLGLIFKLFSMNVLVQLVLLAPLLVVSLALILLSGYRIRRQLKAGRQLVGYCILANLTGYTGFILIELLLQPTGTSYGQPQPVIVVFGALYLFSTGLSLTLLIIALKAGFFRRGLRGWLVGYYILHLTALGGLFYAFYIEPLWLDVTSTTFTEAKLPTGTPPIRIALISDIHMERWTRREDDTLAKLEALDPDLIVISGDFINVDHYEPAGWADLHRFLGQLHARFGVWAAPGSVDTPDLTRQAVAGTPVNLLDDEHTSVTVHGQTLELVGIRTTFKQDVEVLQGLNEGIAADHLKILIYHTPIWLPPPLRAGLTSTWPDTRTAARSPCLFTARSLPPASTDAVTPLAPIIWAARPKPASTSHAASAWKD